MSDRQIMEFPHCAVHTYFLLIFLDGKLFNYYLSINCGFFKKLLDQCDAYHPPLQICRLAPPSNTELFPHEKLRWFQNLFKNFLVVVKMSSLKLHQIVILTSAFFSCISYFQNGVQGQSNNRDSSNKFFLYMDPLGVMVNYTGQTENGNIPHWFGTGTFLDEAEPYTYMGEWKHGLASGFGQIVYANGDKYTGKI